jgi:hypothetical protein
MYIYILRRLQAFAESKFIGARLTDECGEASIMLHCDRISYEHPLGSVDTQKAINHRVIHR